MALRFLILAVLISGCSRSVPQLGSSEPLKEAARNHLVVVESDYKTGLLEILDLVTPEKSTQFPIHSDAVARAPQGSQSVFVLNRFLQDSLLALGVDGLTKQANFSLGAESNPQDIVWLDAERAIVSRFASADLLVLHPTTGATVKSISLAAYADADGIPEMAWMAQDGNKVAVALQRMEKFVPTDHSRIAIINTDTLESTSEVLTRTNPTTEFKRGPDGDWYIGEAGWTGVIAKKDGGIERLGKGTFSPKGLVIEETELGGEIVDFEILTESLGVAIVAQPESKLVSFNPQTGKVLARIDEAAPMKFLQQLVVDRPRGIFYVSDRDPQHYAIRVFSMSTLQEIPEAKRSLRLPPYHVSWMD